MDAVRALNWVDWLVVAGLLAALVWGYLRGLLGAAVSLLGYVAALVVAGRFAGPLAAWANGRWGATARLGQYLERYIKLPPELYELPSGALPVDRVAQQLSALPVPAHYREALATRLVSLIQQDPGRTVGDLIFDLLAQGIVAAAAFVLIVTGVTWAILFLSRRMGGVLDAAPGLGALNRALGALVGGLVFLVSATVLLGLLAPVLSLPALSRLAAHVEASQLTPALLRLYELLGRWLVGRPGGFFLFI